jgi:hypothetical protein
MRIETDHNVPHLKIEEIGIPKIELVLASFLGGPSTLPCQSGSFMVVCFRMLFHIYKFPKGSTEKWVRYYII